MHDKRLLDDVRPARAARLALHPAFLTLYRIRRAAFRRQSMDLYRRYGQVIVLFLALFGILLSGGARLRRRRPRAGAGRGAGRQAKAAAPAPGDPGARPGRPAVSPAPV